MATVMPHSKVVAQHLDEYLKEVQDEVAAASTTLMSSSHYRGIFKTSTALYSTFSACADAVHPLLVAAAAIARRTPLLVACYQLSLAHIELRRFIELSVWYIYFSEHPIEWKNFLGNPVSGFVLSEENPIAYCAHRHMPWYISYLKERLAKDKSALCVPAVNTLARAYKALSSYVHAGAAAAAHTPISSPLDDCSEPRLRTFQTLHREIFSSSALLSVTIRELQLETLGPVERAWFDWLVGRDASRAVRAGSFPVEY